MEGLCHRGHRCTRCTTHTARTPRRRPVGRQSYWAMERPDAVSVRGAAPAEQCGHKHTRPVSGVQTDVAVRVLFPLLGFPSEFAPPPSLVQEVLHIVTVQSCATEDQALGHLIRINQLGHLRTQGSRGCTCKKDSISTRDQTYLGPKHCRAGEGAVRWCHHAPSHATYMEH